jgi:hypothetical protein
MNLEWVLLGEILVQSESNLLRIGFVKVPLLAEKPTPSSAKSGAPNTT